MFDQDAYEKECDNISNIRKTINGLPQEYRGPLRIMLLNLEQLVLHLCIEQVKCRRTRKTTADYVQIEKKIQEYKHDLEQQLVIACLIS